MGRHHPLRAKIPEGMLTFFDQCQIPCGCRDTGGHFIYANAAYFRYFNISDETREYLLDTAATYDEVPPLAPIAEKLAEYDRSVFKTGQFHEAIEAVILNGPVRAFNLVKFPIFVDGEMIGTYFYLHNVQNTPVRYFLHIEEFGLVTFDPPNNLITAREWEVLFMLYRREKQEDIADFFEVTVKTIEAHITSLKKKAQVTTTEALLKVGTEQGWHLFVPPRIIKGFIGAKNKPTKY